MKDQILTFASPEVVNAIDFIEADKDGVHIHLKSGEVEFLPYSKDSKINHNNSEE